MYLQLILYTSEMTAVVVVVVVVGGVCESNWAFSGTKNDTV
jgi:hypothetical protein